MNMRDEDVITDLKQFIVATVSQAIAPVAQDVATLKTDVATLKTDVAAIRQGLDDVNLRLDTIADAQAERFEDHELRIVRLERRAA